MKSRRKSEGQQSPDKPEVAEGAVPWGGAGSAAPAAGEAGAEAAPDAELTAPPESAPDAELTAPPESAPGAELTAPPEAAPDEQITASAEHKASAAGAASGDGKPGAEAAAGPHRGSPQHPVVVGIGASAGGPSALKQFLADVPADSGMATSTSYISRPATREVDLSNEAVEAEAVETTGTQRELEAELDLTKKRLQAVIENYETGQVEMRATVEELQSANEELRSTLEELETSKEELQSMNEELQTVNQENRHKVEELSQLSSDLQNLLTATDIATLFLDRSLRIMRFTPRVGELFNVRLTDRGRPLSDLTHRLGNHELARDARHVLDRLVPVEREIQSVDDRWYLVRVLPYRAAEDRIDGVVVTFVEITVLKNPQEALRKSEERYPLLMENVKEYAILLLDTEGRISSWNSGAERLFGHLEKQTVGKSAAVIFTDEDRAAGAPESEMEIAARTGEATDERWHVRRDGSRFWGSGVLVALHHPDGELRGFAKVLRDNTERKEAEDQMRRWNEDLEHRVRERTEQVRSLASSLTMAEQGERRRISQVLHDNLQQILYGIQMKLNFIRKDAETGEMEQIQKNAGEADSWLSDAIKTTRQLTVDLSPPILHGEGLVEALKWLTVQMKELHHLDVTLQADTMAYTPEEEMRVLLFQIVRELLFNVAKHAGTDRATVSLRKEDQHLVISVADQGRGMDAETIEKDGGGFGLVHARERLGLFGGRMEVRARPGEGTCVTILAPIQAEKQ